MDSVWQWIGLILVGLAAAQLLQWSFLQRQTAALDRQQRELELAALRERVDMLKEERKRRSRSALAWNGFRKFKLIDRVEEAPGIVSFRLAPHDQKPIAFFRPGQYLSFRLRVPDQPRAVVRCYSLSEQYGRRDSYRVTVKKIVHADDAHPGVGSGHLHEFINIGDILDIKAPAGRFLINPQEAADVVLIAAGIGITPIYSMLRALVESGSQREIRFFYGVREPEQLVWREEIDAIAAGNEHVHVRYFLSGLDPQAAAGHGADAGRITVDVLRSELPSSNYQFYLCGPAGMMEEMNDALRDWGVPTDDINFESFGPSTVRRLAPTRMHSDQQVTVTFQRSGKQVNWSDTATSLLDLAEEQGVSMESGCRSGSCGTCVVAIQQGSVDYLLEPDDTPSEGSCLACICRPSTDLVIDA